jgi:hypothetical protein
MLNKDPLPLNDVLDILIKLQTVLDQGGRDIVLVGGQATLFWEVFFNLSPSEILMSGDLDMLMSDRNAIKACAHLLSGKYRFPDFSNVATPSYAVVFFPDKDQNNRRFDMMSSMAGVKSEQVKKYAVPMTMDNGLRLYVIHTHHMLMGRVANTIDLGRSDPHSIAQLLSAIQACKVYTQHILELDINEKQKARAALKLNKQVFALSQSRRGLAIYSKYGIDTLEALERDHHLIPDKAKLIDYPRRLAYIHEERSKLISPEQSPDLGL